VNVILSALFSTLLRSEIIFCPYVYCSMFLYSEYELLILEFYFHTSTYSLDQLIYVFMGRQPLVGAY